MIQHLANTFLPVLALGAGASVALMMNARNACESKNMIHWMLAAVVFTILTVGALVIVCGT